jgi:acetyl/propionyl-CoA carboxylase alpha subunit
MSGAVRQTWLVGDQSFAAELRASDGRVVGQITAGEETTEIDAAAMRQGTHGVRLDVDGRTVRATVVRDGETSWVAIQGRTYRLVREAPGARAAKQGAEQAFAVSPMTGTLAKVAVAPGDVVAEGAPLFIVEAMKMEYVVKAPRAVTVAEVRGAVGEQVEHGAVMVTYASDAS